MNKKFFLSSGFFYAVILLVLPIHIFSQELEDLPIQTSELQSGVSQDSSSIEESTLSSEEFISGAVENGLTDETIENIRQAEKNNPDNTLINSEAFKELSDQEKVDTANVLMGLEEFQHPEDNTPPKDTDFFQPTNVQLNKTEDGNEVDVTMKAMPPDQIEKLQQMLNDEDKDKQIIQKDDGTIHVVGKATTEDMQSPGFRELDDNMHVGDTLNLSSQEFADHLNKEDESISPPSPPLFLPE